MRNGPVLCLLPFYLPGLRRHQTTAVHWSNWFQFLSLLLVELPYGCAVSAKYLIISDITNRSFHRDSSGWETMLGGEHINAHHCRPPAYSQGRICEGRPCPSPHLGPCLGRYNLLIFSIGTSCLYCIVYSVCTAVLSTRSNYAQKHIFHFDSCLQSQYLIPWGKTLPRSDCRFRS